MIIRNLGPTILFDPLERDVNELYIISGYATPNMLSWYMQYLHEKTHRAQLPIRIYLLVGMVSYDGISVSAHEGFVQLICDEKPAEVERLECSYIYDAPAVNANAYIWAKDGAPVIAFAGSAHFVQNSFAVQRREEVMLSCNPNEAMALYQSLIGRSIYVNHAEIEEYIAIHPTHPVFDRENNLAEGVDALEQQGYPVVRLSLVTARTGEPGIHSGLNWGQRPGRNHNEAYISLPAPIARSGFFPLEGQHFTAITDDRHQLVLRVEQEKDKAITTPARNSDLGEYFRSRLGLSNGAFVTRAALDTYGRTDVAFVKFDDETYYMDFSVQ